MKKAPNFREIQMCEYCKHITFTKDSGCCKLFPEDERIIKRIEESGYESESMMRVCDKFERDK